MVVITRLEVWRCGGDNVRCLHPETWSKTASPGKVRAALSYPAPLAHQVISPPHLHRNARSGASRDDDEEAPSSFVHMLPGLAVQAPSKKPTGGEPRAPAALASSPSAQSPAGGGDSGGGKQRQEEDADDDLLLPSEVNRLGSEMYEDDDEKAFFK